MIQRNFKLCNFPLHSVCFLQNFFLSIRTEISVRSLPLCQILQIFTINFQRYLRSKYKSCKIFEGTRLLNLHLRELGVLAQAHAISGPGRTCQETVLSHLKQTHTHTHIHRNTLKNDFQKKLLSDQLMQSHKTVSSLGYI